MSSAQVHTATLGFPRIGARRELKVALESYWAGHITEDELRRTGADLRAANWLLQKQCGITSIPSNDFSFYDTMLDTVVALGATPPRFGEPSGELSFQNYFAMARGRGGAGTPAVAALEMTKWFDTNYHYLVPELVPEQRFKLASNKARDEFLEARALGVHTRPVLIGPITFLKLAKPAGKIFNLLDLLPALLPAYGEWLRQLGAVGCDWVQIDEPALVLDLSPAEREACHAAYQNLTAAGSGLELMLNTYFGALGDNLDTVVGLPVDGLHVDLARAPEQLETVLERAPAAWRLSLGVVDGRNVWRSNLPAILDRLEAALAAMPRAAIEIAPSCSLLHVPVDLGLEPALDAELRSWLAFARQKLDELEAIGGALRAGRGSVAPALQAAAAACATRAASERVHDAEVGRRLQAATDESMTRRQHPFTHRQTQQHQKLHLPPFPTTTIGSFPQTAEVRKARAALRRGELDASDYDAQMRSEIERAIRWQEEIGLDVLVHGEFERNDMVQYFGEQLAGFAFTQFAWVQSYGSRCVRPPIIYGDVSRPRALTVEWWRYAQSLTDKPVKGMLTGPVTILNWSFVRDDLPRSESCRQIALAIRDEVLDLEAAGAGIIQIDEAAFREGLPLRRADWPVYLDWAVECFRLCAAGVADVTQIHSHMCYSEFNDIIDAIAAMDADVISIETSRSHMELLDAFNDIAYPNEIGPGVYDIHSPRVPSVADMGTLLAAARKRLQDGQLWVNPDCGLKTRKWEEVRPALQSMVQAARALRAKVQPA